jgi:Xaa-Pro aminopeptidase
MNRIPQSEFAQRRQALMAVMDPNSIAILPAAPAQMRNTPIARTAISSTCPASLSPKR